MTQQVDEVFASHRSRLDLGHVLRDAQIRAAHRLDTRPPAPVPRFMGREPPWGCVVA